MRVREVVRRVRGAQVPGRVHQARGDVAAVPGVVPPAAAGRGGVGVVVLAEVGVLAVCDLGPRQVEGGQVEGGQMAGRGKVKAIFPDQGRGNLFID